MELRLTGPKPTRLYSTYAQRGSSNILVHNAYGSEVMLGTYRIIASPRNTSDLILQICDYNETSDVAVGISFGGGLTLGPGTSVEFTWDEPVEESGLKCFTVIGGQNTSEVLEYSVMFTPKVVPE